MALKNTERTTLLSEALPLNLVDQRPRHNAQASGWLLQSERHVGCQHRTLREPTENHAVGRKAEMASSIAQQCNQSLAGFGKTVWTIAAKAFEHFRRAAVDEPIEIEV